MAGFEHIYFLGDAGGAFGSDGINPISLMILVGRGSRFWLEPRYMPVPKKIRQDIVYPQHPIGKINVIVPKQDNHSNALIDSCVAFAPELFDKCPSMKKVSEQVGTKTRLDFDLRPQEIPDWDKLRREATPVFENEIRIFRGEIKLIADDIKYTRSLGDQPLGIG